MQPPKPPKPSVPPPLAKPASIPPPAPIPPPGQPGSSSVPAPTPLGASAPAARIPPASAPPAIAPPASVPPAARPASSVPPARPAAPSPSSSPPAQAAPAAIQDFYIKEGDDVRKLGAEQIRLEVASGGLAPSTLICKVGDTEWHDIADSAALGLHLGDLDSITTSRVSDADVMLENGAGESFGKKLIARLSRVEHKGRLIVWGVATAAGMLWVMQRAGSMYAIADFVGLAESYENAEADLLGGPGSGTVRHAEQLWEQQVPEGTVPFSEFEARVSKGEGPKADGEPQPDGEAQPTK